MFLLPHTTVNISDYLPENTQVNGWVYVVPSQGDCAKIWAQAVPGSYDTLKTTRTERWNKQEIQTIAGKWSWIHSSKHYRLHKAEGPTSLLCVKSRCHHSTLQVVLSISGRRKVLVQNCFPPLTDQMSSFSGSFSPGSMPFISREVSVPRYPKRISLRRRESCRMSSASDCTVVYLTLSKSNMSFKYCTIWCCKGKGRFTVRTSPPTCQHKLWGTQHKKGMDLLYQVQRRP